jgi:hypothetical protein
MLDSRGIVNCNTMIWFSSSYQCMSPSAIDRRNFIGGLAMVFPACGRKYESAILSRGGSR